VVREGQGITKAYARFANMQVELIAPTVAESPIRHVLEHHNASDFLARNPGGGLHHVCYAVADLAATRDHLVRCGFRMLGTGGPVIGAGGTPISFLDPASTDGVLIELKQAGSSAG
jgi:methylmalonyl-CoA/ethylmalonyl-CoA epimerase